MTIGGGAVRFPIEAGGALKDIIEAPSLDVVRRARSPEHDIGYAVEAGAEERRRSNPPEDYVSAYDLGRFRSPARFVRHYPEQNPVLGDLLPAITTPTQIVARLTTTSCRGRTTSTCTTSSNCEIHPLDAGHFAWEQAPQDYGRVVAEWVGADTGASQPLDQLARTWSSCRAEWRG